MGEKEGLPPNLKENVELANIEVANNQSVDPGEYWVKIDGEWQKRDSKDGLAWPLIGVTDVKRKGVFIQLDVGNGQPAKRKIENGAKDKKQVRNKFKFSKDIGKVMLWLTCVFLTAIFFVLAYDPLILTSPLNWSIVAIAPIVVCFIKVLKSQPEKDPFELAMEDHTNAAKIRTSSLSKNVARHSKMRRSKINATGPLVWTNKKAVVYEN